MEISKWELCNLSNNKLHQKMWFNFYFKDYRMRFQDLPKTIRIEGLSVDLLQGVFFLFLESNLVDESISDMGNRIINLYHIHFTKGSKQMISIFLSPLQSKACLTFETYSHIASTFKSEDSFSSTKRQSQKHTKRKL